DSRLEGSWERSGLEKPALVYRAFSGNSTWIVRLGGRTTETRVGAVPSPVPGGSGAARAGAEQRGVRERQRSSPRAPRPRAALTGLVLEVEDGDDEIGGVEQREHRQRGEGGRQLPEGQI
ncbi:hypothetical protein DV515_00014317, partial [Chloebia gouldiae]